MKIKAKTFDGKEVEGTHEDFGLIDGFYQSRWIINGHDMTTKVDKDLMEINGNTAAFRLLEEGAFLEAAGIDTKTVEIVDV